MSKQWFSIKTFRSVCWTQYKARKKILKHCLTVVFSRFQCHKMGQQMNIVILKIVSTSLKQGCTVISISPCTFQCMFALLMLMFGNLSQMIIMTSFYATVMCLAVVLCLIALRVRQPHARRPMKVRVRG